jgi:hypothetical protein
VWPVGGHFKPSFGLSGAVAPLDTVFLLPLLTLSRPVASVSPRKLGNVRSVPGIPPIG